MVASTLVIQSHRTPLPWSWMRRCLDSVKHWAKTQGFEYRFVGDDVLFEQVPRQLLDRSDRQIVIATDLGRLRILQAALAEGYRAVVWADADFLIFSPDRFRLIDDEFALGREVWIQRDRQNRPRAYSKVHNAFMMYRPGNSFLDFYADSAERLLRLNEGTVPPQFIGPKLLTALHNIVQCPVMESAGMLSPPVMRDLLNGGGKALDLFRLKSPGRIYAANLSASLAGREGFEEADMNCLIDLLLDRGAIETR